MMASSEPNLSVRYVDQDLELLEQVVESLLNQCGRLRGESMSEGLLPHRLQQTILSGIAALQGLMNTTKPINRVPAEVLVDIFTLVPHSYPVLQRSAFTEQHWPFAIPDQKGYIELARVCRRWRDIIFNTPAFWSAVSESFPQEHTWIPDMWHVDRCPHGPLTIYIRGIVSRRMWRLLDRAAPRVWQLHIDNLDPAQSQAMHRLLRSFPASNLEHCKLHISVPPRTNGPIRSVFCGSASKLRSLYLDGPSFLPSDAFPNLTHLAISLSDVSGEVHWSMGNLCRLLSESPLLEELHLHLWSYLPRSLPTHHSPQLNLNRLRAFTFHMLGIGGAPTTCAVLQAFLPLVRLPPSCRRVDLGPIGVDDLERLAPHILALDQPWTRMRLTLLHPRSSPHPHRTRYLGKISTLEFASSAQPDCGVRILLLKPRGPPWGMPSTFLRSPLLADVEEVWVKTDVCFGALFWSVLLPPRARSLALTVLDDDGLRVGHLVPLMDVRPPLDTLCIVTGEEHASVVQDQLLSLLGCLQSVGPGPRSPPWPNRPDRNGESGGHGSPEHHHIRRVALGIVSRIPLRLPSMASGLNSTGRWHHDGAAAEFCWVSRIGGVDPQAAQGGSEMESLFRAVPELLDPPATVRSGGWCFGPVC